MREGNPTAQPSESEGTARKTNRIRAGLNDGVYEVNALLVNAAGFDHLIRALTANKILFEKHTEVFYSETEQK